MPFVVKFKKVWPRKINADQPRNPRCWMVLITILDDESDCPHLRWDLLSNPDKFKNLSGFSNRMHPDCLQSLWWNPGLKSDPESHLDQGTAPIGIWRRWVFHQFQHQRFLFLQAPVQYHWSSFPSILPRHAPHQEGSFTWNSRWFSLSWFYLYHWLDCRLYLDQPITVTRFSIASAKPKTWSWRFSVPWTHSRSSP